MAENNTLVNLLHTFIRERKKSLQELDALRLQETDFLREGIHPLLGKVTLQQLMGTWVVHDLSHLSQINRIMAYQFAHLVGSFKQFLKILPSS